MDDTCSRCAALERALGRACKTCKHIEPALNMVSPSTPVWVCVVDDNVKRLVTNDAYEQIRSCGAWEFAEKRFAPPDF
jgi:hypothetical protein